MFHLHVIGGEGTTFNTLLSVAVMDLQGVNHVIASMVLVANFYLIGRKIYLSHKNKKQNEEE